MTTAPQNRAAVTAYAGRNLGDDLFMSSLLSRYPGVQFCFFGTNQGLVGIRRFKNWRVVSHREFRRELSTYKLYLILGGSMFQEQPGWLRVWLHYLRRASLARRHRVPVAIVGSNIDPASSRLFKAAYWVLFRISTSISFRDEASASAVPGIPTVAWHPDLAFVASPRILEVRRQENVLGISVMDFGPGRRSFPGYLDLCADLVDAAVTRQQRVRLFAFQDTDGISDQRAAHDVLHRLDSRHREMAEVISYTGQNLDAFLRTFWSCEAIISTRYHAMILALMGRQRLAVLAYDSKINETLNSLRLELPAVELAGLPSSRRALTSLANQLRPCVPDLDLEEVRHGASRHFEFLDAVLQP